MRPGKVHADPKPGVWKPFAPVQPVSSSGRPVTTVADVIRRGTVDGKAVLR